MVVFNIHNNIHLSLTPNYFSYLMQPCMILQNHTPAALFHVIIYLGRSLSMKCIFCKQPTGFMSRYHNDCYQEVESIIQRIENMINRHKDNAVVPKDAKQQLKELANSSTLYKNYMSSKLVDQTTIYTNEVIIHIESGLKIFESKNRCKMVETGYRYEKKPTWSEKQYLLDNSGTIIFTDTALYLYIDSKTMRYPYAKIVNYGFNKIFTINQAYFDVKTTSPFPHRFSFTDTFNRKDGKKEQNICLFLHFLK